MKVYIAAMYKRMEEMRVYKQMVEAAGHECTAKWIDGGEENETPAAGAQMDVDDVARADVVVSFTHERGFMFSGGGRHVEFGLGVAMDKELVLIGPRENVFHHLPHVQVFGSLEEWLESVRR